MLNGKLSRRSLLAGGVALTSIALIRPGFGQAAERVNIATASSNLATTLQTMLRTGGFLDRFGLESEPLFVQDGSKLMAAVISGEVDLCPLSGYAQVFPAVARGAEIKLVNGSIRYGQQCIFSSNPDIKTIADLKGKTIGIGPLGAQLHQVTVALLLKNGISPDEVTWANIGSSGDVYRAIVAKVVDAGSSQIDNIPNAASQGVHQVEGGEMWVDLKDYPFQGGYASNNAIANKRDLLVRTLAAYAALFRHVTGPDSKEDFMEGRRVALTASDAEFDAASEFQWNFMQETQPFANDLMLTAAGVDYVQDLNVRLGIQDAKMAFDKVADMSLAEEAIKLL